jgi:hypothetical protein
MATPGSFVEKDSNPNREKAETDFAEQGFAVHLRGHNPAIACCESGGTRRLPAPRDRFKLRA